MYPFIAERARLARWYAAARVVVMPGAHETFGLVGFEAAACGASVVTCSTAPSAALMRGIARTYEPGDIDGLLAAIESARAAAARCRCRGARWPRAPRGAWRSPPELAGLQRLRGRRIGDVRLTLAVGPQAVKPGAEPAALTAAAERLLRANWREGERPSGRAVRVHVPRAAALPPHVALGLVLSRDRLAALRSGARARRAAHRAALRHGPTAFSRTRSSGMRPRAGGARRCTRRAASSATGARRRSARRCCRSPGRSSLTHPPTSRRFALRRCRRSAAHLDWLAHERDPDGDGLLTIIVPDESGLDDSPKYEPVFGRMTHDRPGYWLLMERGRRARWDARALIERYDHHVEDVWVNVAYALSLRAMARLSERPALARARRAGRAGAARAMPGRAQRAVLRPRGARPSGRCASRPGLRCRRSLLRRVARARAPASGGGASARPAPLPRRRRDPVGQHAGAVVQPAL